MPIAIVLAHMEMVGMPVDRALIEAEREPLRSFARQVRGVRVDGWIDAERSHFLCGSEAL